MNRETLDRWCERGILGLVLAILVLGPLATGAVRPVEFLVIQGLTLGVLLLWVARLGLIACAVIHIWAAAVLSRENLTARGVPYGVKHTIQATLSSRLMRWSGVVVLAFLLYHLAHFTGTHRVQAYGGFIQEQDFRVMD